MAKGTPGSVWFREQRGARQRPQLSRERIVAAALTLLDAEGVQRLSMRTLAARLDVHATSLYWHVATKDDVLDLALDAVLGEFDPPAPSGDWRVDLTAFAEGLRGVLLAHPWAPQLAGVRPLAGPHALRTTEFAYAALAGGGFAVDDLPPAVGLVSHYVIGAAQAESIWRRPADEEAARAAVGERLMSQAEAYPQLAAAFPQHPDRARDFRRGLEFVLAGLDATGAG